MKTLLSLSFAALCLGKHHAKHTEEVPFTSSDLLSFMATPLTIYEDKAHEKPLVSMEIRKIVELGLHTYAHMHQDKALLKQLKNIDFDGLEPEISDDTDNIEQADENVEDDEFLFVPHLPKPHIGSPLMEADVADNEFTQICIGGDVCIGKIPIHIHI